MNMVNNMQHDKMKLRSKFNTWYIIRNVLSSRLLETQHIEIILISVFHCFSLQNL